jgi:hypothetical protein
MVGMVGMFQELRSRFAKKRTNLESQKVSFESRRATRTRRANPSEPKLVKIFIMNQIGRFREERTQLGYLAYYQKVGSEKGHIFDENGWLRSAIRIGTPANQRDVPCRPLFRENSANPETEVWPTKPECATKQDGRLHISLSI